MAANNYYNTITSYKNTIIQDVQTIFRVYGNELLLRLEELNLLNNDNNVIESSTALGFVIEEFVVCKLQTYYQESKFRFYRPDANSTTLSSYDCYYQNSNLLVMVNIKAEKEGVSNDAVAAINALHSDYCIKNKIPKAYLVLKIHYKCGRKENIRTNPRKIIITQIDAYFLEEINLVNCGQDHRNWSREFKSQSGRLKITKTNLKKDKLSIDKISYKNTENQINSIFQNCLNNK